MPTIEELQAQLEAANNENKTLKGDLEKLKKPPEGGEGGGEGGGKGGKGKDEEDLVEKAAREKKELEEAQSKSKGVEKALRFDMGLPDYLKNNKGLLPPEVEKILEGAKKENYDSAVQKSAAIKSALVVSFFSVKDNVELLTASQRETLDSFLKLTKNGREDRAESLYENLLEPALESLRRVRKAEQVSRANMGYSDGGTFEDDYKNRLMKGSRKAYFGEKGE